MSAIKIARATAVARATRGQNNASGGNSSLEPATQSAPTAAGYGSVTLATRLQGDHICVEPVGAKTTGGGGGGGAAGNETYDQNQYVSIPLLDDHRYIPSYTLWQQPQNPDDIVLIGFEEEEEGADNCFCGRYGFIRFPRWAKFLLFGVFASFMLVGLIVFIVNYMEAA